MLEGLDRSGELQGLRYLDTADLKDLQANLHKSSSLSRVWSSMARKPEQFASQVCPALRDAASSSRDASDRTTAIGQMIDAYLKQSTELDDRAIHLLFSANRWECAYVSVAVLVSSSFV